MAQVYQLTMLLELYRVFPELLDSEGQENAHPKSPSSTKPAEANHFESLVALAISCLTVLSSVPQTSGTKAIQLLPLVIAGSALQHSGQSMADSLSITPHCSSQVVVSLFSTRSVVTYWRSVVRERLTNLSRYVGLDSAKRGIKIVGKVWMRADMQSWSDGTECEAEHRVLIDWAEVMSEENLDTLLGLFQHRKCQSNLRPDA